LGVINRWSLRDVRKVKGKINWNREKMENNMRTEEKLFVALAEEKINEEMKYF
jgi:Ser-tRNA(Ala) deacylase AlaX